MKEFLQGPMHPFLMKVSYSIVMESVPYRITFHRGLSGVINSMGGDIQVTPSRIYTNMLENHSKEKVIRMLTESMKTAIEMPNSEQSFSRSPNAFELTDMETDEFEEISYKEYLELFSTPKTIRGTYMARFVITGEEFYAQKMSGMKGDKILYPFSGRVGTNTEERTRAMQKMLKVERVCELLEEVEEHMSRDKVKEVRKEVKPMESLDELVEYVDSINKKDGPEMSVEVVDVYLRSRHDLLGKAFLDSLGMASVGCERGEMDVDLKKVGYNGRFANKTPDMLFSAPGNCLDMIDVAVTDGICSDRALSKREKYDPVMKDMVAQNICTRGTVDVLVYSTRTNEIMCPAKYKTAHVMASLESAASKIQVADIMMRGFNSYKGYRALHTQWEGEEVDEKADEKVQRMIEVCTDIFSEVESLDEMKAKKMRAEAKTFYRTEEFVKNKEDKMVADAKEDCKNFDGEAFREELVSDFKDMFTNAKYTEEIRKAVCTSQEEIVSELNKMDELSPTEEMNRAKKDYGKSFPMPIPQKLNDMKDVKMHVTDSKGGSLFDGTIFLNDCTKAGNTKKKENMAGIGANLLDRKFMENMVEKMSRDATFEFTNNMAKVYKDPQMKMFNELAVAEVTHFWTDLYRNIARLEGRRRAKRNGDSGKKVSRFTVIKEFGDYCLAVKAGSALTQEKQIRVKIFSPYKHMEGMECQKLKSKEDCKSYMDVTIARNQYTKEYSEVYQTEWLTVSVADVEHYSMLYERSAAIHSQVMADREEFESTRAQKMTREEYRRSAMVMVPILVMMCHKRGVSTSLQYNRYIMHGLTAFASDKVSMVKNIMKDPVRTMFEASIRAMQMDYAERLTMAAPDIIKQYAEKMASEFADYDRIYMPSFKVAGMLVEFAEVMNDIYMSNLFNKEKGTSGHRLVPIMTKMSEQERHYLSMSELFPGASTGDADFDALAKNKMQTHTFNKKFVMYMGYQLRMKIIHSPDLNKGLMRAMTTTIRETMSMRSSLKSCPLYEESVDYSDKLTTATAFETMCEQVEELESIFLMDMVTCTDVVNAVFKLFPKSQIGGPREILIQAAKLRLHVKFLEKMFYELCSLHEKEMLTHADVKKDLQSNATSVYKKMILEMNKHKDESETSPSGIILSFNTDASRWSPGFVMDSFVYFCLMMPLPVNLKEFCVTVIRAFATKTMFLPPTLTRRWQTDKLWNEKTDDKNINWLKENFVSSRGTAIFKSGMGQGMLHYFSSLFHCAKDDVMDSVMCFLFSKSYGDAACTTLISSDDLTKIFLVRYTKMSDLTAFMVSMLQVHDMTNRMANITTNWKKSALSILTEFNSYFSTGKRATDSVLKAVYNSQNIVDMTEPEKAVKSSISQMRNAFENGVKIPTIKVMFELQSVALSSIYAIDGERKEEIMRKLECDRNSLPFQLGYMSTDRVVEQMIAGPEVLMYKEGNSEKVMEFYVKYYAAYMTDVEMAASPDYTEEEMEEDRDYMASMNGKTKMTLPFRFDTKIKEMKKRLMNKRSITREDIDKLAERNTALSFSDRSDSASFFSNMDTYMFQMDRKFGFNDSIRVHILIRALAMAGEDIALISSSRVVATDFVGVVDKILKNDDTKSKFHLTAPFKEVCEMGEIAEKEAEIAIPSHSYSHNKSRKINFTPMKDRVKVSDMEVFRYMMRATSNASNSAMTEANKISESLGVKLEKFIEYPIYQIKKAFPGVRRPLTMLKSYIMYWLKMTSDLNMEMMVSFPDNSEALTNMRMLYLEKYSNRGILQMFVPKKSLRVTSEERFNSALSMRGRVDRFEVEEFRGDLTEGPMENLVRDPWAIDNPLLTVIPSDSLEVRFAKMAVSATDEDKYSFQGAKSLKVFYKVEVNGKMKTRYYTDLVHLGIIHEDRQASPHTVSVRMYKVSSSDVELGNITRLMHKDLSTIQIRPWAPRTDNLGVEKNAKIGNLWIKVYRIWPKTELILTRRMTKWTVLAMFNERELGGKVFFHIGTNSYKMPFNEDSENPNIRKFSELVVSSKLDLSDVEEILNDLGIADNSMFAPDNRIKEAEFEAEVDSTIYEMMDVSQAVEDYSVENVMGAISATDFGISSSSMATKLNAEMFSSIGKEEMGGMSMDFTSLAGLAGAFSGLKEIDTTAHMEEEPLEEGMSLREYMGTVYTSVKRVFEKFYSFDQRLVMNTVNDIQRNFIGDEKKRKLAVVCNMVYTAVYMKMTGTVNPTTGMSGLAQMDALRDFKENKGYNSASDTLVVMVQMVTTGLVTEIFSSIGEKTPTLNSLIKLDIAFNTKRAVALDRMVTKVQDKRRSLLSIL